MRVFILLFLLLINVSVFSEQNSSDKPNIIFILVDDQRYDALGFLDHPYLKTPSIDHLAKQGVYFDQAFVTTSLCSPSRASILTGQYTHKHNVMNNNTDISPDISTYPKELQKEGYKTGFVGKWHMGHDTDERRPGFDYWVSFKGQGNYQNPQLNINGQREKVEGHMTDILTDLAINFIQEKVKNNEPYMLSLSYKAVHEQFLAPKRHRGTYKNQEITYPASYANTDENYKGKPKWVRKQRFSWHGSQRDFSKDGVEGDNLERFIETYAETMLGVDDNIGRITETLDQLGQLGNTVIIYYSDNGYLHGEHGLIDKRVMYEESIRVPGFIHWPEKIKKGSVNSEFILNIDIAPTILDIAGANIPEAMQGESFLPLVLGKNVNWRQDFIYEYFVDPAAVQTPTILGLRTKNYSYMVYPEIWDVHELYDIKNDPKQMNNLLGDVEYGIIYGTFLDYAIKQLPELAPSLVKLDNRLTTLIEQTEGLRVPVWHMPNTDD